MCFYFLHGFLGSPADFSPLIDLIGGKAIELPGHGKTPFTTDLSLLLPPGELPIDLVGYSMGGRIALWLKDHFPKRIRRVYLLSSHIGPLSKEERETKKEIDANWERLLLELPLDQFLNRWYDQPIFNSFRPPMKERLKHNPEHLAQALIHYSITSLPPAQSTPDLLLVGEHDAKYRALYPQAPIIPNAGHMIHIENPRAVALQLEKTDKALYGNNT